jgi:K+-sensing histidine kinase KdpD
LESELSEDQKESLISVKECADLLLHIINSVLDLAKIEAGRLEVESVPFNIGKLVSSTLRMLQARAQERGLQLLWEVDIGVPQVLVGDVGKIQQCLLNLGEFSLVLFSPPLPSSLSLSLSHRKAVIILSVDFHCFQKCCRNSGHRMLLFLFA